MPAIITNTPVRKAFTLYADTEANIRPYVAIAAQERIERSILLGVHLGGQQYETELESADFDPAALRNRWRAIQNLRISMIEPRENRYRPRLMLRDGATPFAHVDWDGSNEKMREQAHQLVVREAAKYLKNSVADSDWPYPYFDPTFDFRGRYGKPSQFWLRMRFFDGNVSDILLESGDFTQWQADAIWGPAMDSYTLQLEDISGASGAQQVVIYDKQRTAVRTIPYDSTSPQGHKASQANVMEGIRETYALHKSPRPQLTS